MKPIEEMAQAELGAFVQTHVGKQGIDVALSGGAAVRIYSSGNYVSQDHFANRLCEGQTR